MAAIFSCCIRRDRSPPSISSQPTETTHLLGSDQGPSTPTISHQPAPQPDPEAQEQDAEELEALFNDMVGTMVRPKAANPFLTGEARTPSGSRNPSPRSIGTSSRGQRSLSRGRTTNAFQVRRVRIGRNGMAIGNGPPSAGSGGPAEVVREEEERSPGPALPGAVGGGEGEGALNGGASRDGAESVMTERSEVPTRMSTQTREELERQKYTVKLKTAEVVRPWKSQISQGD